MKKKFLPNKCIDYFSFTRKIYVIRKQEIIYLVLCQVTLIFHLILFTKYIIILYRRSCMYLLLRRLLSTSLKIIMLFCKMKWVYALETLKRYWNSIILMIRFLKAAVVEKWRQQTLKKKEIVQSVSFAWKVFQLSFNIKFSAVLM